MIDQDKMRALVIGLRSTGQDGTADAIDLLLAEVEAAAADAKRYRFLRHADLDELAAANWKDGQVYEGEALDAAIDEAIAQRQGEGS